MKQTLFLLLLLTSFNASAGAVKTIYPTSLKCGGSEVKAMRAPEGYQRIVFEVTPSFAFTDLSNASGGSSKRNQFNAAEGVLRQHDNPYFYTISTKISATETMSVNFIAPHYRSLEQPNAQLRIGGEAYIYNSTKSDVYTYKIDCQLQIGKIEK